MKKNTCRDCRHFASTEAGPQAFDGICKRFPPRPVGIITSDANGEIETEVITYFPYTTASGWCGEFNP